MSSETRELVQRASRGDRPAIDELLQQHLPGLRAFIRLRANPLLRRCESESDLAQSVCREVLEQVHRFQYADDNGFRRWLYTTALRKILDRQEYWLAGKRDVRRAASDVAISNLGDVYRSFSTPSRHAIRQEEIESVERAFDRLEEPQREVISLAHVVGLSRAEIAAHLGKSEGAVRTMLSRALADLAAVLNAK